MSEAEAGGARPAPPPAPVTVGVPVYNNGTTLRRTVESLLAQSVPPALIHISDNASTDATEAEGRALAAGHRGVRYTRHEAGLGAPGNFRFLLDHAETPYFMWLAADDYVLPTYIEKTLARLLARPELTTCVSRVQFTRHDMPTTLATGSETLDGSVRQNLARYLDGPGHNARVYGLHRTAALRAAFPPGRFHAYDWALMAGTLLHGLHEEWPEVLMVRDETPGASYVRQVRNDNSGAWNRLFPLLPMTRDLCFRQKIPLDSHAIRTLVRTNLEHHLLYAREYHRGYYQAIGRHLERQIWRISPRAGKT